MEDITGAMNENKFKLVGSFKEGGFSAGFFNSRDPTLDVDIGMSGTGFIDKEHRHCIERINKTDFVRIKAGSENGTYWRSFIEGCSNGVMGAYKEIFNNQGYFKTYELKEIMRLTKAFRASNYQLLTAVILDVPLRRVDVKQSRQVTKSTSEQTNYIYWMVN